MDTLFNKSEVAIIGGGGLGREIESWFDRSNLSKEFKLSGFVDDNPNVTNGKSTLPVLGGLNIDVLREAKNLIIGIADSKIKRKVLDIYYQYGGFEILNFEHDLALSGKHSTNGLGLVRTPFTVVSCNCDIGDAVLINSGSQIGHDVKIGNYCNIMANVDIGGNAVIEDDVFIGSRSVVLPGIRVVKGTKIGAGSVIVRNINVPGTYFGNPGKRIF